MPQLPSSDSKLTSWRYVATNEKDFDNNASMIIYDLVRMRLGILQSLVTEKLM